MELRYIKGPPTLLFRSFGLGLGGKRNKKRVVYFVCIVAAYTFNERTEKGSLPQKSPHGTTTTTMCTSTAMTALVKVLIGLGAAAPAQDYFKLSLEAIQDAAHHLDSQDGQNFNRRRCELLVQKLSDTGRILTGQSRICVT